MDTGEDKRRLSHVVMAITGFMLSPLSWWNDLLINIPLAYLFSWPFAAIHASMFMPAFILGYWLSNLLGLLMLHHAAVGWFKNQHDRFSVKSSIVVSLIYSVLIFLIVMLGWLDSPVEYLQHE